MKKLFFLLSFTFLGTVYAQDAIEYKTPPKEIFDLVMAKPSPGVSIDTKGEWMLIMERSAMPSIEELAQPELRIAGLRINPNNFGPSRSAYTIGIRLKNIKTNTESTITGLPNGIKAGNFQWSPNDEKIAFTNTTNSSIDLYLIDVKQKKATKINKLPVNTVMGGAFEWYDNTSILYLAAPKPSSEAPKKLLAPKGPTVQQNLGKVAASVTYQDLIKSPYDEQLFEFYATSQLIKNTNGAETKVGAPLIYSSFELSPDNKYMLVEKIDKPFSYLVTAGGFNSTVFLTDVNGKTLSILDKLPSNELAPSGYDNVLNAPLHKIRTDKIQINKYKIKDYLPSNIIKQYSNLDI